MLIHAYIKMYSFHLIFTVAVSGIVSKSLSEFSLVKALNQLEKQVHHLDNDMTDTAVASFNDLRKQLGLRPSSQLSPSLLPSLPSNLGAERLTAGDFLNEINTKYASQLTQNHLETIGQLSVRNALENDSIFNRIKNHTDRMINFDKVTDNLITEVLNCIIDLVIQRCGDMAREKHLRSDGSHWNNVILETSKEVEEKLIPLIVQKLADILDANADYVKRVSVDLTLTAYGGNLQETIMTNAALHTYAEFSRKRSMVEDEPNVGRIRGEMINGAADMAVYSIVDEINSDSSRTHWKDQNVEETEMKEDAKHWNCTSEEAKGLVDAVMAIVLEDLKGMPIERLNCIVQQDGFVKFDATDCVFSKNETIRRAYNNITNENSDNYILYRLFDSAIENLLMDEQDVHKGEQLVLQGESLGEHCSKAQASHREAVASKADSMRMKYMLQAVKQVAVSLVMEIADTVTLPPELEEVRNRLNQAMYQKVDVFEYIMS